MESKAAVDGKSAECLFVFLTMVMVRGVMLTMMITRMTLTMMMTRMVTVRDKLHAWVS